MPYKTISFKLLRPTASKRKILDDALQRYTAAFSTLLRDVRGDLPAHKLNRSECVRFLDRGRMELVNHLGVHPFKDSLKLDLSMLLTLWSRGQGAYPVTSTGDACIRRLLGSEQPPNSRKIASAFLKYNKVRPLLFGRYDTCRDYSLLQDRQTGRYYAKLYLWSRSGAVDPPATEKNSLYHLIPSDSPLGMPAGKVRFALFPLETGDWQLRHLQDIESGNAIPKSALLLCCGADYYLQVRVWYPDPQPIRPRTSLGIVRGVDTPLYYALCGLEGKLLEEGAIEAENIGGKNYVHALANKVLELAEKHQSRILLENLVSAGDDLELVSAEPPLPPALYNQTADVISYKVAFAGLPPCVRVSARRIYQRCPVCGTAKKANRFSRDNILCVSCGAFSQSVKSAALNLANTLLRYQQTKIPVSYATAHGHVVFFQEDLDFTCTCQDTPFALQSFLSSLKSYLDSDPGNLSLRQRSIIKKLRSGGNLQDCLAFAQH